MSKLYSNHSHLSKVLKHSTLPILITKEFDFFRCVEFNQNFYEKTASELFHGNLRDSNSSNRYSQLFPNQKLSYWSDTPDTSRKEILKHGSSKNIVTFWAYDDLTSTFPTLENEEPLIIIDGIRFGFEDILEKCDKNTPLSEEDIVLIDQINNENPDCIAYKSTITGTANFLFFEKGFKKLALLEVSLKMGELKSNNTNSIICAGTSDYLLILKSYGECFIPIAQTKMNENYLKSAEYKSRSKIYNH
ncbi:hypothetical protein PTB14_05950 [Enterococcus faecalis]|uniref:hypothetical protein n=1 Tax=Enterococcus faecalis TaxID=1351 RepID=UPI0021589702|nr:hypothetical protein [Enterococcus faecalis]MDD0849945.1 hypothetical protein [Enterococcus faecalis]MEB6094043.1 hypothetical protein [Enterococcus faecalis]